MTAEEGLRSHPKWAEHGSCGEMATAFISVGAYYASPRRLKISRDRRIQDESCDKLRIPRRRGLNSPLATRLLASQL
jgi:hypothetical protein